MKKVKSLHEIMSSACGNECQHCGACEMEYRSQFHYDDSIEHNTAPTIVSPVIEDELPF